jgi:hypothetical protein
MGSAGIVLATGLEVTEANRPRVPLGQMLYAPLIEAKQALGGVSHHPDHAVVHSSVTLVTHTVDDATACGVGDLLHQICN